MEESVLPEAAVESREEVMVSPSGGKATKRIAHFLKPTVTSTDEPVFGIPSHSLSSRPSTFKPNEWPLKVSFKGWRLPQKEWNTWVDQMASLHESTWIKAGIREAIFNSKYKIQCKADFLILGLAEKWCIDTKSFIFPWGEATITLEDMIMFGYSVLGSPVFGKQEKMEDTVEKLEVARTELCRSSSRKADHPTWLKKFMGSGNEIEHEAFLALWLSRFVFPSKFSVIDKSVFPVAVQLARGTRICLAPSILASIYRDLSKLKENVFVLGKLDGCSKESISLNIAVWAPLQLVQIWAWERFVELRPKPNIIKGDEPRFALWHEKIGRVENVRRVLDSAKESFDWRPYARTTKSLILPKFYVEKETWVLFNSDSPEELESFARCLRVSKLVGFDCIEEYFPHRVAMQFGFDQDLPAHVALANETPEKAWLDYNMQITYKKLYIPSRFFEADVTTRYLEWWKRSVSCLEHADMEEDDLQLKSIFTSFRKTLKRSREEEASSSKKIFKRRKKGHKEVDGSSSFTLMPKKVNVKNARNYRKNFKLQLRRFIAMKGDDYGSIDIDSLKRSVKLVETYKVKIEEDKEVSPSSGCGCEALNKKALMEADKSLTPPGFPPKANLMVGKNWTEEDSLTIAELLKFKKRHGDSGEFELYSSASDRVDKRNIKSQAELVEKTKHKELDRGRPETAANDAKLTKVASPNGDVENIQPTNEDGDGDEDANVVVVDTRLEDRVSRIERIIAELKAVRFGHLSAS